jgi:hypothetical protein
MKSIVHAALITALLGGSAIATAPPAFAGIGVSLDFGDVAIGYRDGYWDSHHHWHHWRHSDDYRAYGRAHPDSYHDWGHNDHGH